MGDENNYVRYNNSKFITACLIDTESPNSFIKISKVRKYVIELPVLSSFYVLNKSSLKTYGKILCYIIKKNLNKIQFDPAVLGDFYRQAYRSFLNLENKLERNRQLKEKFQPLFTSIYL